MPIDEPSTPHAAHDDATDAPEARADDPIDDRLPEDDAVEDPTDLLPEDDLDGAEEPPAEDFEFDDDEIDPTNPDAALIARARRRYGTAGAIVAGGMLGLDKLLGQKVKQEAPVEWEAPGEPLDIDRKGITVPIDDDAVVRSRPGPAAAAGAISRKVTRRRRP